MADYDCLIIGYNDLNFQDYMKVLKSMGTDHADYRDLNLNFLEYQNKPYRALEILTHFYNQGNNNIAGPFHNADLLWPVITYLGTYLSKRGFTFDFVNSFQLEKDRLKEKLQENNYLAVAVTTTLYTFDLPILEVISLVRRYNDTAKIIVGGPYISKRAETMEQESLQSIFKLIGADFYVYCREGEQTLVHLLNALKNKSTFHHIDNLAYKNGKGYVMTKHSGEINSLEENLIDYSLFSREAIGSTVNLRISKGCPYKCAFCGFPLRSEKYRTMSVEQVEKTLNAIRDVGSVTNLFFIDDTVNVPNPRFKDILRMMIRQKYNFQWDCLFRCDICDEETAALLKEAGCEAVFLGLESANDTILKNMNKTARKNDYRKPIQLLKDAGIITFVSLIVGFPGETYETFRETMDFLVESKADFYRPQLWFCDTITPIWQQREKYGLTGYHFGWSHDTMDARAACNLLEKAFLQIDTPIWVPDPGFNFPSIGYMKKRGMTTGQVKTFLKCFNAIVKEQLIFPDKKEISPRLLENLIKICQYDRPGEPDVSAVEMYSSTDYVEAETFWTEEFENQSPASNPVIMSARHDAGDTAQTGGNQRLSDPAILEKTRVDKLKSLYDTDLSDIILAAYSTLLVRLHGQEEVTIVVSPDENEVFPLRLHPLWTSGFGNFVQTIRQKLREAMKHRLYAFHILTDPLRMAEYNSSCPGFTAAYLLAESQQEEVNLEERLPYYPNVYQGIKLVLRVLINKDEDEVKIQFRYSTGKYGQETIEKLTGFLLSILNEVMENREILLKEIALEPEGKKHKLVVEQQTGKAFNF